MSITDDHFCDGSKYSGKLPDMPDYDYFVHNKVSVRISKPKTCVRTSLLPIGYEMWKAGEWKFCPATKYQVEWLKRNSFEHKDDVPEPDYEGVTTTVSPKEITENPSVTDVVEIIDAELTKQRQLTLKRSLHSLVDENPEYVWDALQQAAKRQKK